MSDESLVALLRQRGWPDRRVYDGLVAYYEAELGMAIPGRGSRGEQARDAFLYLLAFITLGFWTVATFWLADVLIDRAFPSALYPSYSNYTYTMQDLAGQLASIIVAFPIFLLVSRLIAREVARRPEALESGVRKWLTYIALVIAAMALLGDAIAFLGQALAGDLTVNVALKELVLFVITFGVFSYYLGTVRAEKTSPAFERSYAWAAVVTVFIGLALGFRSTGSPAAVRAAMFDQRRIDKIEIIARAIHENWSESHGKRYALPKNLSTLVATDGLSDPSTNSPFRYMPGGGTTYRICATFESENHEPSAKAWNHPAGAYCFGLDAKRPVD